MTNKSSCFLLFALLLVTHAAYALLPIQHWETRRGARVYFVENHDLPMLDLSVDFPRARDSTRRRSRAWRT